MDSNCNCFLYIKINSTNTVQKISSLGNFSQNSRRNLFFHEIQGVFKDFKEVKKNQGEFKVFKEFKEL